MAVTVELSSWRGSEPLEAMDMFWGLMTGFSSLKQKPRMVMRLAAPDPA